MRDWILLLLLFLPLGIPAQDVSPIANAPGQLTWTENQIKAVFVGDRSQWPNGKPVIVVLPSSESDSFERTAQWALDTDAFDYQKHWLSLVFQGRANAPVFVKNEAEVVEYVQTHPGAIGVLHSASPPSDLRLKIQ